MCSLITPDAVAPRIKAVSGQLSAINPVAFGELIKELDAIALLLESTPPPGEDIHDYLPGVISLIQLIELFLK